MLEKNRLYDHLIKEIGKSPLDEPSEELAEIVDCIAHGIYGLKDRGIELILKKEHTLEEEELDNAFLCFPVVDDDHELICEILRLMYITYDLAKIPAFIEQG